MMNASALPTVVIIDDHPLFRDGLTQLLGSAFTIVATGSTSAEARHLAATLGPQILLLDVELHSEPAEATIRHVRRTAPRTAIVVLTMFDDSILERRLREAGAAAYAKKSIEHNTLVEVMRNALSPLSRTSASSPTVAREILSPRELDVLRLIAAAASNKTIATNLLISEGTVKRHTTNLYAKLGAVSRIDAVRKATTHGIL